MKHSRSIRPLLASAVLASSFLSGGAAAQDAGGRAESATPGSQEPSAQLLDVPLEDLLTLESTSVAKKRQRVSESAAAVYVLTQEDIRRSPASTIPDLLRTVPGVEVAHQTNGAYAVSIRGFNSRLSNSILVMIDGRSIYVSTLSGIFWDQLLLPLTDIERIEVVRGPGATLWGANAVNGVINIITKHSSDTLGVTAAARVSSRKQEANLSYGGRFSEVLSFRLYGNFRHDNGLVSASGADIGRRWQGQTAGARADWEPDPVNAVTLQAEYSGGAFDAPYQFINEDLLAPGYVTRQTENRFQAMNVLGRWTHRRNDRLDWTLQVHYDRVDRTEFGAANLLWQLADVDLGVHWRASDTHDINFGVGARILHDRVRGIAAFSFDRSSQTDKWVSGYLQDDITLVPDKLRLTVGAKVEHNNITGVEFQPSARLFYRPADSFAAWAAVSRAVRTPSRFERSARLALTVDLPGSPINPFPIPIYGRLVGLPERGEEVLVAYEAGARAQLSPTWSLDIAAYLNDYDRLSAPSFAAATPLFVPAVPFPVGLLVDYAFTGKGKARTWGAEVLLKGQLRPWWRAEASYSHLDFRVRKDPATGEPYTLLFALEGSPRHQFSLRNSVDIGDRLSIDGQLRYVSRLRQGSIPSYTGGDLRVTYRPLVGLELSAVGENLFDKRRPEFAQPQYPTPRAYVPRSISAELRYRF